MATMSMVTSFVATFFLVCRVCGGTKKTKQERQKKRLQRKVIYMVLIYIGLLYYVANTKTAYKGSQFRDGTDQSKWEKQFICS